MILIDNFTRIQNMKRIKDIFDALHQFDLGFAKGLMHILLFGKTDAVFARDKAAYFAGLAV